MLPDIDSLKALLTPDASRLPADVQAKLIQKYGKRVGEKSLRNIVQTSAQPYQIRAVRDAIEADATAATLHKAAEGKTRHWLLYSALLQIDHPLSEHMIRAALSDQLFAAMDQLIQAIPRSHSPLRFAPELRKIADTQNHPGWGYAVTALGEIQDEDACLLLMGQTDGQIQDRTILQALRHIGLDVALPTFRAALDHKDRNTQLQALWGLGKLGDEAAVLILVAMLDDSKPVTQDADPQKGVGARKSNPGLARRAAQALADIHGWNMEWSAQGQTELVSRVKALYPDGKVQAAIEANPSMANILSKQP